LVDYWALHLSQSDATSLPKPVPISTTTTTTINAKPVPFPSILYCTRFHGSLLHYKPRLPDLESAVKLLLIKGAWAIPPADVSPDYPGSKVRKHLYPDIALLTAIQGVAAEKLDTSVGLSIVRCLAGAATAVSELHVVNCKGVTSHLVVLAWWLSMPSSRSIPQLSSCIVSICWADES
jgi:hypothetical protein